MVVPTKTGLLWAHIVDNHSHSAKRKSLDVAGTPLNRPTEFRASDPIDLGRAPVHKEM
jgi:hypothetical protein